MTAAIHFVETSLANERGGNRCHLCDKRLVKGDDWTVHARLATC